MPLREILRCSNLPISLPTGAAAGGSLAAYTSWGKFKSVPEILSDMDKDQRQLLYDHFTAIITGIEAHDVTSLGRLIAGDPLIRGQALMGLKDFVGGQLKMQIID